MLSTKNFKLLAFSFDESVEQSHFQKTSFRVNKKIFATLDLTKKIVAVKLSEIDQSVYCEIDKTMIHPATGERGKKG